MSFLKNKKYYLAIIGDIQGSREIENRMEFQRKFHQLMEELNRQFEKNIISPFTVTLGDEFQAVLKNADAIFDLPYLLKTSLPHLNVFIGMGIGEIETEIFTHTSVGMDGPCFRIARSQLEAAKKESPRVRIGIQDIEYQILNSYLLLMEILEFQQTSHQKQIIELYQKLRNQVEVARQLGITQAAVSQALKGAHFQEITKARENLIKFLNQFL